MENNNIQIGAIESLLPNYLQAQKYAQVVVIVDENTKMHCFPKIAQCIDSPLLIEIVSGEKNKTIRTCEQIWQALTDNAVDRKALIINLGGGVIGDMGGFCAATYKRGIDFINIPTTLLSMVDASVGGKLGIDFGMFKNQIGLFQQPNAVLIAPAFLKTLAPRELKSGYAEVIKHALIKDESAWGDLLANEWKTTDWEAIIKHSIGIKTTVVSKDPTEQGERKVLNFGHTIGHAIESHYLSHSDKPLLHGEAIAIGMICEAYLSTQKLDLDVDELDSIVSHIIKHFGKIELDDFEAIEALMIHDKKNKNNTIQAVLLNKIGMPKFDIPIGSMEIQNALNYYNSLNV